MKIPSSPKTIIVILSANIIILTSLFIWFYSKSKDAENSNGICNSELLSKTLINKVLPKYEFIDPDGNNQYENMIKGKVLLVMLKSDCPACQKEITLLSEHFTEISNQIRIIGITMENEDQTKSFIKKNNIQFPIIIDKNGDMMLKARVACTPTNFIVENGIIKKITFGKFNTLEEIIEL